MVTGNPADQGEKQAGLQGAEELFRGLHAQENTVGTWGMQEAVPQPRQEEGEGAAQEGWQAGQRDEPELQLRAAVPELAEASALHRCAGRKTVL